ncbi:hypothetical protein [Streptomyces rishiriensis]|uniref:Uncharacterized protein n=1 Tax=Streptomyces rishiriensis TaxID=68264 RepID=A0ABU0P232_STRRH|nr:hypothetical protein [Streptomyces rishiriensis]MDQ0585450.1 hypothetical protein [Streptomyces rishiriensis]
MSEQSPSQAEGERHQDPQSADAPEESERRDVPRTTPSQAEGEDVGEDETEEG